MQNDLIPADVDITEESVTQTSEKVAEEPVAYTSEEVAAKSEESMAEVEKTVEDPVLYTAEEASGESLEYEADEPVQEAQAYTSGGTVQEAQAYTSDEIVQEAQAYTSYDEEVAAADESEEEPVGNGQSRTYAGFFTRLTAYLLDKLILLIPLGLVRLIMGILSIAVNVNILQRQVFFKVTPADMILYSITAIYFVLMTYMTGRTIGKRIMRIQVVSVEDRKPTFLEILFRETFGRFLSTFILCIGYLMIVAGKEKQALHDHLADTRVIFDCNR
jgi:uncharacterized RDD family membrane protein YckC